MLIYDKNTGTTRGTCGTGAGGISVSTYTATAAPIARDGYLIPAGREAGSATPLAQVAADVMYVALALGQDTVSQPEYKKYRAAHPDQKLMGDQNVRRRFQTWNNALRAAGLNAREMNRDYRGLNDGDLVIWLAHWLRHYRHAGRGLVQATRVEYKAWVEANPKAPSEQLVAEHGFTQLREQAARMEQSMEVLPTTKPLAGYGRTKGQTTQMTTDLAA